MCEIFSGQNYFYLNSLYRVQLYFALVIESTYVFVIRQLATECLVLGIYSRKVPYYHVNSTVSFIYGGELEIFQVGRIFFHSFLYSACVSNKRAYKIMVKCFLEGIQDLAPGLYAAAVDRASGPISEVKAMYWDVLCPATRGAAI